MEQMLLCGDNIKELLCRVSLFLFKVVIIVTVPGNNKAAFTRYLIIHVSDYFLYRIGVAFT